MHVSIPKPCAENWEQMNVALDAARFCDSCQKCVVDFSAMSDKEILHRLKSSEGKVCGRFTSAQLDRVLVSQTYKPRNYWSAFFSVALTSVVGLNNSVKAETNLKPKVEILPYSNRFGLKNNADSVTQDSSIIVSGIVEDNLTKEPKNSVKVGINTSYNNDTLVEIEADIDGKFKIAIPKSIPIGALKIYFSNPDYISEEFPLEWFIKNRGKEILLTNLKTPLLGEVVITGYTTRGKVNHFFRKLFNWHRAK